MPLDFWCHIVIHEYNHYIFQEDDEECGSGSGMIERDGEVSSQVFFHPKMILTIAALLDNVD